MSQFIQIVRDWVEVHRKLVADPDGKRLFVVETENEINVEGYTTDAYSVTTLMVRAHGFFKADDSKLGFSEALDTRGGSSGFVTEQELREGLSLFTTWWTEDEPSHGYVSVDQILLALIARKEPAQ